MEELDRSESPVDGEDIVSGLAEDWRIRRI